jgi:formylglycine-generating enzyme required for sulfatase activity
MIFVFALLGAIGFSETSFARESAEFANKFVEVHGLTGARAQNMKRILTTMPFSTRNIDTEDPYALQGPHDSWHPATRAACVQKVIATGLIQQNSEYERLCGAKWMVPVPAKGQPLRSAKVCIDQFEFPDMPCEYPVVWAPASTAKRICEAMGKRVCNSHEWEGACAGGIDNHDPYLFELPSLQERRARANATREHVWAFQWNPKFAGRTDTRQICGVFTPNDPDFDPIIRRQVSTIYSSIGKSPQCSGTTSDYKTCGTNTWPAGFKYDCRTQSGIFDMHGNVAEVMNFPTSPSGLARVGHTDKTERKGSFFVYRGHQYPDDCRVRQPYEHFHDYATDQHSYYQEGFRCCKDVQ